VVLPGALIAVILSAINVDLAQVLYLILNEVLHLLAGFLSSLQHIAVQLKSETGFITIVLLFVMLLGALLLYRIKGVLLVLVLTLILYFCQSPRMTDEGSKLIVFDAGQGLAILLQTGGHVWLYDTGAAFERSSVAENVILPYLRSRNIQELVTGVVVSHGDWDHAGGIGYLLSVLNPEHFWSGELARLQSPYPAMPCIQGMHWQFEQASIEVLYPASPESGLSSNNHSCVLRIWLEGQVFLLMGDLEGEGEQRFLQQNQQDIQADVLVAGHHGSKNATSYALLKRVKPKVVVFAAGYRNRFGHPHWKVLDRVSRMGAESYNTAENGAVSFVIDTSGAWTVTQERSASSPFWITR